VFQSPGVQNLLTLSNLVLFFLSILLAGQELLGSTHKTLPSDLGLLLKHQCLRFPFM